MEGRGLNDKLDNGYKGTRGGERRSFKYGDVWRKCVRWGDRETERSMKKTYGEQEDMRKES